jgi:ABC-type transporter Mla MlaB component
MSATDFAFAIRTGEHACCRTGHDEDRERLALASLHAGLQRGHKVVYLCDGDRVDDTLARLRVTDAEVESALTRGQLDVRDAASVYSPNGTFDVEQMLEVVQGERAVALAEGYAGLSLTGDVSAGVDAAPGAERLAEYERRLDEEVGDSSQVVLCQYDHEKFDATTLDDVCAAHRVDVPPALAAIGRTGVLAAARAHTPDTLRLAGELDFESAGSVAAALDEQFQEPFQMDLADLRFIDVAGIRMLRGPTDHVLTISAASEPVRRLVELLGWDTDPAVKIAA